MNIGNIVTILFLLKRFRVG